MTYTKLINSVAFLFYPSQAIHFPPEKSWVAQDMFIKKNGCFCVELNREIRHNGVKCVIKK